MSRSIPFVKYHGTGNDFIIVDQREVEHISYAETDLVQRMCQRHFGIGADGLMILARSEAADFEMIYFNSDGQRSTMCGNGGRCIVHFAHSLGAIGTETTFLAIDQLYSAKVLDESIALKMPDVLSIRRDDEAYVLDTGSPHYVRLADTDDHQRIREIGVAVRYNATYNEKGINVNLLTIRASDLLVSTYERGVEDKTLSCGTGVTAAALVAHREASTPSPVQVSTDGGELQVTFEVYKGQYRNVWLSGPAKLVFKGQWTVTA